MWSHYFCKLISYTLAIVLQLRQQHHFWVFWKVLTVCFVTKAMPTHDLCYANNNYDIKIFCFFVIWIKGQKPKVRTSERSTSQIEVDWRFLYITPNNYLTDMLPIIIIQMHIATIMSLSWHPWSNLQLLDDLHCSYYLADLLPNKIIHKLHEQ